MQTRTCILCTLLVNSILITMCECEDYVAIVDMRTPINASLSAFYKRSFAYYTVHERLPRILTQTIDSLVRNKNEISRKYGGNEAQEELKTVIGKLSKLKYEMQTNKPLKNLTSSAPDVKVYNDYLAQQTSKTYYSSIWLHIECYMYRRIRVIFELTKHLSTYDPFRIQKQESFAESSQAMRHLSAYLILLLNAESGTKNTKEEFFKLVKVNLWGNKCDLSFHAMTNGLINDPFQTLVSLEPNVLSDRSENVWEAVSDLTTNQSQIIDIVFDNAGYEVFTDLCLADFLITNGFASSMRMYVKAIPWFVSDVTTHDFNWTLEQLISSNDDNMKVLGRRWSNYVKNNIWTIVNDDFFTYPMGFASLAQIKPDLYRKFSEAKFIIFKGDLNYRKLLNEKNWEPSTPLEVAIQEFAPAKLCTLRTVKSDIICGLDAGVVDALTLKEPNWMETGNYGVIQYSGKVSLI